MKNRTFLYILILIVISILAYLPLVGRFGYTHDDWYLMYSAGAYGPSVFKDIFSVDRPARALVMIPAYILFGKNVLFYNLSAYVFRLISSLSLLWLLQILWPRRQSLAIFSALLFLIYPGFLSQFNGIDYQSQMVALAAAVLSISISVKATLTKNFLPRVLMFLVAILLGWLYLGLVEYFIGFEVLRWSSFYILASGNPGRWKDKVLASVKNGWLSLSIPLVFLIWRLFFFVSERGATDVGLQLDIFKLYPLQTLFHWGVQVLQDLFDVMLAAWVIPLLQLSGYIQVWDVLIGIALVSVILLFLFRFGNDFENEVTESSGAPRDALWLGLLIAITGLIPIAMVNRDVSFPTYSRYSLASSVGVAIFFVALLSIFRSRVVRYSSLGLLIFIALLTHHANAVKFSLEISVERSFWWQVSWRIPQLEPRTTLIGNYPAGVIEEDYFIWGPANIIYYPGKQDAQNIVPTLFSALLNEDTVTKVFARERQEYDNRKNIITYKNYRNILILNQPAANSCVHVINGLQPEFSAFELEPIREIASFSEIERVLVDQSPHMPPAVVFGPEPDHGWCYYYQKADLARQRGDWDEVLRLGREVSEKGLIAGDPIEWMPFLQAYASSNDTDRLTELAPLIITESNISQQVCNVLNSMPGVSASARETIKSLYCAQ